MAEHHAAITVHAPVEQVYPMWTHFNDFPTFMHFVKEVTYYDEQRSHWVADIVGRHEWDAMNDTWIPNEQIAWHSTDGLHNAGKVTFRSVGPDQTRIDVYITYEPPAGVLGDIGETLGAGKRFEQGLQQDLIHFARMVEEAPVDARDPTASNYLFHEDSAVARGQTTREQYATMDGTL
ncbi:MAG: SRPBCC family protein [Ktedonobacterales bacterium]